MKIIWMTETITEPKRKRDGNEMSKIQAVHSKSTPQLDFIKEIVMWTIFKQREIKCETGGYIFKMAMLQLVENKKNYWHATYSLCKDISSVIFFFSFFILWK